MGVELPAGYNMLRLRKPSDRYAGIIKINVNNKGIRDNILTETKKLRDASDPASSNGTRK